MKPVTLPREPVQGGTASDEAYRRLMLQQATVRGSEIVFLKARGWTPCGEDGIGGRMSGQEVIDQGELPTWRRGVVGEESWEHDEAVAFAVRTYMDEQNEANR